MTDRAPRVAIYAGSFDPPTNGHVDVVRRGAVLFDELVVAVGNNPAKKYWFDLDERTALLQASLADVKNVRVVHFSGLLVHAAADQGAGVILRGVRALSDFDLEFRNGLANRDLADIETLFLLTDPDNMFVSSSLVKEIVQNGGDISRYVPAPVLAAVTERLAR